MSESEKCVVCGEVIPEGIQVCPTCEKKIVKVESTDNTYHVDNVFKGDVYFADLNPVVGHEVGGIRPVVIIQNDIGNRNGPTVVAAITSRTNKKRRPTHVLVNASTGGLIKDSVIMLEQIRTLDKARLRQFLGRVDGTTLQRIEEAAKTSLGIID
jgi:mRNA interferase MazF